MANPRNGLGFTRLLIVLLALSCVLFAQTPKGRISGVVTDTTGAVVPGATVTLTQDATGETQTTKATEEGSFVFPQLDSGFYTVRIEVTGFRTGVYRAVQVEPSQQFSLNAKLEVGVSTETVEITAEQALVNTTSSEVSNTVMQTQILSLPLLGRNPIELIRLQAGTPGILSATRNTTTINGGRPGWTQVTQDGINIQDNFIRNNALDFVPNRPTADTIGEFAIITNNVGADSAGGTSQVRLQTPKGDNQYHGGVFWYNRNSALAANGFFRNRNNLDRAQLNQNQFGGRLGGAVLKNKLFFFGSYEGFRLRQGTSSNNIIPTNDDYIQGWYRYIPTAGPGAGVEQRVNVIDLVNAHNTAAGTPIGLALNPFVQSEILSHLKPASLANSTDCGDSTRRNRTCHSFTQGDPTDRDQYAMRFDYNMTQSHSLEFIYQRFEDLDTRTDIDNVNAAATASLSTTTDLVVGAWRWVVNSSLINEFRVGNNNSVVPFLRGMDNPTVLFGGAANNAPTVAGLNLTAPFTYFMPQGRKVSTRNWIDTASWNAGNHSWQFGGSLQQVDVSPYNFVNTIPAMTMGLQPANAMTTTSVAFGGNTPSTTDLNAMNGLAGFLGGRVNNLSQTFQVQDASSGYVDGYPNRRDFEYEIWSGYAQDNWRLRPNLNVRFGLKYEYWAPMREKNSLALMPEVTTNGVDALMDPVGNVITYKDLWEPDRMQFAPTFGVAWDPFGQGKTSIRGGYSLAFVNEDMVTASQNVINGNFGMAGPVSTPVNLTLTGAPTVPTPAFVVPRTYAQQIADGGITSAAFLIDQELRQSYAHQLNFSVSHEIGWNTAVEIRYVGTLGRDLLRGVDYNQQMGTSNPAFFADFQRARANLITCGSVTAAAPCGQALTFLPTLDNGGSLTNATVINNIRTGQVGELANFYTSRRSGPAPNFPNAPNVFLPNPSIYVANLLENGAKSSYHALQTEVRRRLAGGLQFQGNYTWSKLMSNANGNSQARFEPFLDNSRPELDYNRSEYDLTHVVNSNFVYDLPFGRGRAWMNGGNGLVDRLVGGWQLSSIIRWQSGNPLSILSNRGVINRAGRSNVAGLGQTAVSSLSKEEIRGLFGIREVNGLIYYIDPRVINSATGQAVGPTESLTYGNTGFANQVFFNPQPGETGSFNRLTFSGPSVFGWDASVAKSVKVTERISTKLRADFFNVLNMTQFGLFGDYDVNSTSFGRITSTSVPARVVQISLRVEF